MNLRQAALTAFVRHFTSLRRTERRHRRAEILRRMRGAPRKVLYFHQVNDPYSALSAQVLEALAAAYEIEIVPKLVGRPDPVLIASPHLAEYRSWVRKDAADIAPHFGLAFEDPGRDPLPELVALGERILAGCAADRFAGLASRVSGAVWRGDAALLDSVAREVTLAPREATRGLLQRNEKLRRRRGHVYGGTFYFAGEWFLSVDRLEYLEARLVAQGACRSPEGRRVMPRPREQGSILSGESGLTLEFFPSVRSPYTYAAMERTRDLARRTGVSLVIRPVLPLMMRGGYSGRTSQAAYVYSDSAREAETYGVERFDPCECVGRPVERCYALFPWARDRGRGFELLHAFLRGVFAERVDAGTDAGLRRIVENAGLPWEEARPRLRDESWREEIDANLVALRSTGLWGVPSFRLSGGDLPSFHTWGADRLWLLEREICRRAGRVSGSSRRAE